MPQLKEASDCGVLASECLHLGLAEWVCNTDNWIGSTDMCFG